MHGNGATAVILFICAAAALFRFCVGGSVRWRTAALWLYIAGVLAGAAGIVWALI